MGLRQASSNYTKFLTYLVIIILVNIVGVTLFFRIDLTKNNIYSISEASKKVVSTLSEPLTINVFFTRNLPAPHNNTERYIHDLLEEYANYANRYFNYRFYDVSPDEGDMHPETKENRELAKGYGIFPVQIQAIEEDEVKFQKAYMGLVLIHGDLIEKIPTITSTDGLEYRLTTAMRKLNNKVSALLNLKDKIMIRLFLSSSLEAVAPFMRLKRLPDLPEQIKSVVEKLNDKNYGKLQFEYLDPSKDESLVPLLDKHDILHLQWPALSNGKIPPGKGAIGLVMEYGDKAVTTPLIRILRIPIIGTQYELAEIKTMEETINKNVESLIDINEDLGLLADHGTLGFQVTPPAGPMGQPVQRDINNFRTLTSQNYTIKEVRLKEGNIPEGLNCLIIAGPTEDFSDYELFQIDQFLMQGKSLALYLDAFKEVMPPNQQGMYGYNQGPVYLPINTGLEKLLSHYGVGVKKSYVMDESCYKQEAPAQLGGGQQAVYYAPLIKNRNIDSDLAFMKNIKGMITLKISPLELDAERISENGLEVRELFSSSEKSWEMSGRINLNPMLIQPPQSPDKQQSLPLACVLQGNFPSYFEGKPIPEKETADNGTKEDRKEETDKKSEIDLSKITGMGQFISRGKPGKIFLLASSEMLTDNLLDAQGRNPNAMFVMNVLDYLNNRVKTAVMRSKAQRFNPLHDTGAGTKTFVKAFNMAGLPVMVIAFGLLVWFRRHSRKKRIEMIFHTETRRV
ncbi:MAG: Gldg family protein [Thermodesulfobacteriota bacterium]|nr:Gldg family protein [Thermodesulfobacteriota bacterium]